MKKLLLVCLVATTFISCKADFKDLLEKARQSAKANPVVTIDELKPYTHEEKRSIARATFVKTLALTTLSFLGIGPLITNAATRKLLGWGAGIGALLGYICAEFAYADPLFTERMHVWFNIKVRDAINDPATGTQFPADHEYYHGTVYRHLRK